MNGGPLIIWNKKQKLREPWKHIDEQRMTSQVVAPITCDYSPLLITLRVAYFKVWQVLIEPGTQLTFHVHPHRNNDTKEIMIQYKYGPYLA